MQIGRSVSGTQAVFGRYNGRLVPPLYPKYEEWHFCAPATLHFAGFHQHGLPDLCLSGIISRSFISSDSFMVIQLPPLTL